MLFDTSKKMWGYLDEETSKLFNSKSGEEATIYLDLGKGKKVPLDIYIYNMRYSDEECSQYFGVFFDDGEWYNVNVVFFTDNRHSNIVLTPVIGTPKLTEKGLQNYYSRKIQELEPAGNNLKA